MLINASATHIPIPDKSVHTVCTSPPYFALRRYQGEQGVEWPEVTYSPYPGLPPITIEPMRAMLGLEPTPEAFVGHIVLIWREMWRVLRDDGVSWMVIGDSYAGSWGNYSHKQGNRKAMDNYTDIRPPTSYYPPGDLMFIPHRIALALQADGWIIRNDIVYAKTNSTPESVRGWTWMRCRVKVKYLRDPSSKPNPDRNDEGHSDLGGNPHIEYEECPGCAKCEPNDGYVVRRGSWRHTRQHEYVLMAVKKMGYWCDQEIVREPVSQSSIDRMKRGGGQGKYADGESNNQRKAKPLGLDVQGRNPRSVITTSTANYKGSHYAVFPSSLVRSLIKSSTPSRCCSECGRGWAPMVNRTGHVNKREDAHVPGNTPSKVDSTGWAPTTTRPIGYKPLCACNNPNRIPGIVLDPFIGSGTTGLVAIEEGLRYIGTDISHEYLNEQAKERLKNIQMRLM